MMNLNIECCSCNIKQECRNLVSVKVKPKWEFPISGNLITKEGPYAVAMVCDYCANSPNQKIRYVVEHKGEKYIRHNITSLDKS